MIAQKVMDGEFDGETKSYRESITIGLRSFSDPICKKAIARLESIKK
jgi:hypothetical protein